jgi:outer membrane receptor for ferrienterochelin and colicins
VLPARRWLIVAIAVSIRAVPTLADSQEPPAESLGTMSLEQLMQMRVETVYGASKYEQKVTRAPASVTILTSEDIGRFGYRTLAEALRSIRGLYVSDDRNYSYLGTRGFLRPGDYNSRILLLIDGHRINDNIYDGAYFSREAPVNLDMIERIEFVRGPSSSIYGSSAFFGIVNVVLKHAKELDGAALSAAAGSFGAREGNFLLGDTAANGVETTLGASYFESHGHRSLYFPEFDPAVSENWRANNSGIASDRDGERAVGVTGSIGRGSLRLSGAFYSRRKEVPTASFDTTFNEAEETLDERGYLDATYDAALAPDVHVLGRLAYDQYTYRGNYPYDDLPMNRDEAVATSVSTEWQLTKTLAGGHTLVAGMEFGDNLKQRQLNFYLVEPRVYGVQDDRKTRNGGLYVQGELRVSDLLLLNTGLRYDYYFDSFGGTLNPRLGAIFSPTARTTLKLLYGEAFRAPNAYERFYYAANLSTQTLEPETIRTYEGVFEQYLGDRDRLSVSLYRYTVDNLITQQVDDLGELYFDNVSRVSAHGAEIELERKYDNGTMIRGSYAWQKTRNPETSEELTASPHHLAKLNFTLPIRSWASLGAELQYQGAARTLLGNQADDFTLANVSFQTAPRKDGFQFEAGVYNVFDTRYAYPGAEDHLQDTITQDGRTFRLKVTRRF